MEWTRRNALVGLAATIVPVHGSTAATKTDTGTPILLEARKSTLRLVPPPAGLTAVWAYNGQIPGPLIRLKKGEGVKVRLVNKLDQPTSLCWHGVRIANAMDGVAGLTQPPVNPGDSLDYRFTPPDAGVYWYHPHVFPHSAEQIGRGLYGLLIVDEPDPPPVDHDLLVVLDDWALDAKGQIDGNFLDKASASHQGRIGPLLTVNGAPAPGATMAVRPGARLRLRILNACSARIALLSFAALNLTVVAIDGQTSELFQPAGTIPIGPGSRFEVMADVPIEAGQAPAIMLRGDGAPDRTLMSFSTKGAALSAHAPVVRLPTNPLLPTRIPLEKSLKRDLILGGGADAPAFEPRQKPASKKEKIVAKRQKTKLDKLESGAPLNNTAPNDPPWLWTVDGRGSDGYSGAPLFKVKKGNAVTLAFVNRTAFVQQMHVHGHVFRVLHDLDDGWDPYWRESILVGAGKTKHVAFIADNPGKWAVESLILDRQVTGLAGWFEVT